MRGMSFRAEVLGTDPWASCMLGKRWTTELQCSETDAYHIPQAGLKPVNLPPQLL